MTVFLRLVLAHFLAEFVFLRDFVSSMKSQKKVLGYALHGIVYMLCIILTCGGYLNLPWIVIGNCVFNGWHLLLPVTVVHLLADILNRADVCRGGNYNTVYFLLWQMIDILIFFLIFPVIPAQELSQYGLYADKFFAIAAGAIFVAYFTMLLLFYIEKDLQCAGGLPSSDENFAGILFRTSLFFLLLIPSYWGYVLGFLWIGLVLFTKTLKVIDVSYLRFTAGAVCSVFAAFTVKFFIL
ncbi:MAG: DUF3307 domain-containing protein [Elusimicrobiota bacterium]|jgi:hypothetical protein|nr:DUF3307 domain-containing protein [Elusimicrobiota bacterium]